MELVKNSPVINGLLIVIVTGTTESTWMFER